MAWPPRAPERASHQPLLPVCMGLKEKSSSLSSIRQEICFMAKPFQGFAPIHWDNKCGLQPLEPLLQPSQEAPLEKAMQRAGSIARIRKLHQCRYSNCWQVIHSSRGQPCVLVVIFSCCCGSEHAFVHPQKGMVVDFSWGKEGCLELRRRQLFFHQYNLAHPVLWIVFLGKMLCLLILPGERCNKQLLVQCLQVAEHCSELIVSSAQGFCCLQSLRGKSLKKQPFLKMDRFDGINLTTTVIASVWWCLLC